MIEKPVLEITHKDGGLNAEAVVECPFCHEGYKYRAPFTGMSPGQNVNVLCDGQEGCGQEFTFLVK